MEEYFNTIDNSYKEKTQNKDHVLVQEMIQYVRPFVTNFLKIDKDICDKEWILFNIKKYSDCKKKDEYTYIADSIVAGNGINFESIIETKNVNETLNLLKSLPQPEQRTKEWYDYRHSVITASSLSKVLETKSSYQSILKEKVLPESERPFITSKALSHGIRNEEIAQIIYELEMNCKISEYGCIQHQTIGHLGASPDGIVTQTKDPLLLGRMLEIKCLYSRKLTGIPKYNYWIQMQIQLETCNLEYCDFFECKINDNLTEENFYNKIETETIKSYYGIIIEYMSEGKTKWIYSKLNQSIEDFKKWHDENIDLFTEKDNNNKWYNKTYFWELDKYSLITVKRNREWFNLIKPKLEKFWSEVEEKRKEIESDSSLIHKIFPIKETKRKNSVTGVEKSVCYLNGDTDDDEFV